MKSRKRGEGCWSATLVMVTWLTALVALCPTLVQAYSCIDEGEVPILPIPEHNISSPDPLGVVCADQLPDTKRCLPLVWATGACQGGYYESGNVTKQCPPFFYCPSNQVCMIPCPVGAYCVASYWNNTLKICKPDYKSRQVPDKKNPAFFTCGGPSSLDSASCDAGFYCPTINESYICPKGHYCRAGRITPQPCPWLSSCKAKTAAPILNAIGLVFDGVLIVLVLLFWLALRYRHDLTKFFQKRVRPHLPCCRGSETYQLRGNGDGDAELIGLEGQHGTQYGSTSNASVQPKTFTVQINFKNLSLTLNGNKKKVLQGATGELRPRTLTAIMGGSGAGKTTLLNALSGKAYYGTVEGSVKINGLEANIATYRSVMGFVPQEDIMHRDLTAREVLFYQSMLRLSACATFAEINRKVDEVLALLGISHIANSQIGDEEKRGISGGQRKRVNIGMELVADPTLLFLDEPTSGLDSVSSMQVCEALRRVAEEGHLTVVAVLHQPRFEIFEMFHEVVLLQPGGTIAFQGSTHEAQSYFTELGYPVRASVNPSDHYLDVIDEHNKKAESRLARSPSQASAAVSDEADSGGPMRSMGDMWTTRQESVTTDGAAQKLTPNYTVDFTPRKAPSFFIQLLFFLRRAFILQFRQLGVLVLDQLLVLIAGAVLGALYSEVLLQKLALLLCMTSMAVSLTSMLSALRCFGNNKPVFWRESAAGINRPAYFLAVNISQLPIILFTPLAFLSLFYALISPRAYFRDFYTGVLVLVWASHGLGYLISTVFNNRSSQMATVVLVLVSAMLSGAQPSLCKMKKYKVIGPIIYSLSFARWFVEALFEKEALRYPEVLVDKVALFSSYQGYDLNSFGLCIGMLFVFGFVARLLALLFLMFTNRGQQK